MSASVRLVFACLCAMLFVLVSHDGEGERKEAEMGKRRNAGDRNPRWRGGRYVTREGYVMVQIGIGSPMADCRGYVYEHRKVMAESIGRPLRSDELVHHKDENRQNNDLSNLEVVTRFEHKVLHRERDLGRRLPGEGNPMIACRCGCGTTFAKFDASGRQRRVATGHNRVGRHPRRDDEGNVLTIVCRDEARQWTREIAVLDADVVFSDLIQMGF